MANCQLPPYGLVRYWFAGLVVLIVVLTAWPGCACADALQVRAVVLSHWPPQYESGEYGQPTGFAIDIMDQVAAAADIDVIYEVVDSWAEAFEALRNGRADLIPNQGITLERKEWFAFTSPVETSSVVIFVRQSTSDITIPADFRGRTVASVQHNVGARLMDQFSAIEHKVFPNVKEALLELLAGHVDALIYPRSVLMKMAIEAGLDDRIKVVGPPMAEIKRGISVRKDNAALLHRLEPVVNQLVLSKKYDQIYAHWYGRPSPFWTPKRIIITMTGMVFILALWHSFRVTKVNRRLKLIISDKKRAENALWANEDKYRLILENQTDLTIKMDARKRLLFASPSFCEAFGVSKQHLEGIHFLSLVHRQDLEDVTLAMQSLLVMPHTCRHEGRALTPRGWQWFSWSSKAILDSDGQIREIISVGRNITERKEAEVHLVQSQKMEAIGTLAEGVSHDFNNILSIILGNIELAVLDVPQGHPVMGRLYEIQTAGIRAKEVVCRLISLSRKEQESRVPVLLAPLVEESLLLLRASIPATIDIRKHIIDADMTIMADAAQIHQVLINLCTNAAQAMVDEGGSIDVTLSSTVLDRQASRGDDIKPGAHAIIRVEDTGCGMAPETIERIFDPYFTTRKDNGGTGMGLSIVHGIVSRHNGIVEVEKSRPGGGTTFKIVLPLSEQAMVQKADVDEQIGPGDARILLVDDEQVIATIGREYLDKLGYHAQVFTNASEALAKFKADPSHFDLIITDMIMSDMNGKALAKEILKIRPDIPIILCSGYHNAMDEGGDNTNGINYFLQKPYNMKAMADAVRQVLSVKSVDQNNPVS